MAILGAAAGAGLVEWQKPVNGRVLGEGTLTGLGHGQNWVKVEQSSSAQL